MRILHLINDEKFTDFVIRAFQKVNPENHTFLVGVSKGVNVLNHIKEVESVLVKEALTQEYFDVVKTQDFQAVVVHELDPKKAIALKFLNKNCIRVWLCWGGDFYNTPLYQASLYHPETRSILDKKFKGLTFPNILYTARKIRRELYFRVKYKRSYLQFLKETISRFDFCGTVLPEEYNLLNRIPYFNAKYIPFSYGSLETDFKVEKLDIEDEINVGTGILVGNSRAPSSNHLDVFSRIHKLVAGRRIIVPLNYGIDLNYADEVILRGQQLFGDSFMPITSFLSKDEYIRILKKAGVAIMFHERQQAMGNLILLIWLGTKVYLSQNSLAYEFFRSKGFEVFAFQDDKALAGIHQNLSREEVLHNRKLLMNEYSIGVVMERLKSFDETLIGAIECNNLG